MVHWLLVTKVNLDLNKEKGRLKGNSFHLNNRSM